VRKIFGSYRVAIETVVIVAALIAIRAVLWSIGVEGISTSPLTSSIVAGGVFVMGLVVAGTLSDYRTPSEHPPTWRRGCTRSCARPSRSRRYGESRTCARSGSGSSPW
jgi:hypothetical protein